MAWNSKTFQRFGRFIHTRQIGIVTSTTTVVLGVVLYKRLKKQKTATAAAPDRREPLTDPSDGGCGKTEMYLSACTSGIKWDENWDRREPMAFPCVKPAPKPCDCDDEEYKEKAKDRIPVANRHILLIRHGQYCDTAATDCDRILTILGREQSKLTGQRLCELDLEYTRIVSSTMQRAIETSDIIRQNLPRLTCERDPVLCEGAPIKPEPYHSTWKPDSYQFYQDGARIEAAFRKYFHRADPDQRCDSVEILVCHANVIRYFVCRAMQFPPEAWLRMSMAHTSFTHIMIRPSGRVILKCLGNAGHLPASKVTFS